MNFFLKNICFNTLLHILISQSMFADVPGLSSTTFLSTDPTPSYDFKISEHELITVSTLFTAACHADNKGYLLSLINEKAFSDLVKKFFRGFHRNEKDFAEIQKLLNALKLYPKGDASPVIYENIIESFQNLLNNPQFLEINNDIDVLKSKFLKILKSLNYAEISRFCEIYPNLLNYVTMHANKNALEELQSPEFAHLSGLRPKPFDEYMDEYEEKIKDTKEKAIWNLSKIVYDNVKTVVGEIIHALDNLSELPRDATDEQIDAVSQKIIQSLTYSCIYTVDN
jgi:hypothetical protein